MKDRWAFQAADGSEHKEVVTMCCAIKPTASWLLEETVSVCRERCGGQGYLSCNRSDLKCSFNGFTCISPLFKLTKPGFSVVIFKFVRKIKTYPLMEQKHRKIYSPFISHNNTCD